MILYGNALYIQQNDKLICYNCRAWIHYLATPIFQNVMTRWGSFICINNLISDIIMLLRTPFIWLLLAEHIIIYWERAHCAMIGQINKLQA